MAHRKTDPESPPRFSIKLDSTTNGEYEPRPLPPRTALALREAERAAGDHARRLGISRRDFMASTCGAATVLLAINQTYGCGGSNAYSIPPGAELDRELASSALGGDEFIFDVQTHHVAIDRKWWVDERPTIAKFLLTTPQAHCAGPAEDLRCLDRDHYLKHVFLDSDTDIAVLSALWGAPEMNAINETEMMHTRQRLAAMQGSPRLLIQGHIYGKSMAPEQTEEQMHALVHTFDVDAWKLYPVWSMDGKGYRLDHEETGGRLLDQGLALGVDVFAVHKGLRVPGMPEAATDALDVGPAALAFPSARILVYHSAYDSQHVEGAYDPSATTGVDTLIRSVERAGFAPNQGNVYAELGSVWREVMKDPAQAQHVLGKLLKHIGEDRILWGTDAIWYGSPQDQIMAFRAFQISEEYQERFGYPALTQQAKAKIFGLNAAAVYGLDPTVIRKAQAWDPLARAREEYKNNPRPSFETLGPRTRRELVGLQRLERMWEG